MCINLLSLTIADHTKKTSNTNNSLLHLPNKQFDIGDTKNAMSFSIPTFVTSELTNKSNENFYTPINAHSTYQISSKQVPLSTTIINISNNRGQPITCRVYKIQNHKITL